MCEPSRQTCEKLDYCSFVPQNCYFEKASCWTSKSSKYSPTFQLTHVLNWIFKQMYLTSDEQPVKSWLGSELRQATHNLESGIYICRFPCPKFIILMILLTLTASANNLICNKPSIIFWVRYCEVITLTLSCPLSIKLSPVCLAGWRVVYSWGRLGSLSCVPEVWIFQIQCVGWTCACAFHAKFYRHIVALPKNNTNTCYNPYHYHMCAFHTKFYCHIIALSKNNTDSWYDCHCFTMFACAFHTKFYCHIIA